MAVTGAKSGLQGNASNRICGLEAAGFESPGPVHWNLQARELVDLATARGEGRLSVDGALAVTTGQHTGRSAQDKFIVREAASEHEVWWDNNKAMSRSKFDLLHADMLAHARGRELFVQDLYAGAEPAHRLSTRIVSERAWHSLFIRNLLIRPPHGELASFVPRLTIIDLPSFRAHPERHGCRTETVIACDLLRGVVLIAGTSYAGEIKKAVFTFLNYHLPEAGVLPMHCSANTDAGDNTTVFFGLSGTGKTTLSADASRILIGDDEHGWGESGVFNFEGGCYAKTIRLSQQAEPEIFAATKRFGTVLENVVLDAAGRPDFVDATLTENTRCAYPLDFIENASPTGRAGHPRNIVMLTADAFGVLPPIAKLSPSQAMYHFLSGYTAKVAGTEKGVVEPQATFSTCFGAPFMPRHPSVYGNRLRNLIARHGVACWLVNTGWTGGAYGTGSRMPIAATRALLAAVLDGSLRRAKFRTDPFFGFAVPVAVAGVEAKLLDPRSTWGDARGYDEAATRLVAMFAANFEKFEHHVGADIRSASPAMRAAAE